MTDKKGKILYKKWGMLKGHPIYLFTLKNKDDSYVELTNYGATIVSVVVPDKQQHLGNVVLGFPSLEGYLQDSCYIGSTIGRYANRIGNSCFELDGITYQLDANDKDNSNHGGFTGFNKKVFDFEIHDNTISFSLHSKDGEGGFPGNLRLTVDYTWNEKHHLSITYKATTDKKTIANFTNHSYFNLSGGKNNILEHDLFLDSNQILGSTHDYIPTGSIVSSPNKVFETKVKEQISVNDNSVKGMNDCFILNKNKGVANCRLIDFVSGRSLKVFTSYPAILVYSGDFLSSSLPGHSGEMYKPFDGICLECQYYPDSPNHSNFPRTTLDKEQQYLENILFEFSLK
jgi:aldose 1-epimerase